MDYYNYHEYGFIPAITDFLGLSQNITIDNYTIPTIVKDAFFDKISMRAKLSIFKANNRESYDVEKTNFVFEASEAYPTLFSSVFIFSLDFLKIELTEKELISLIKKNESMLENGWCKLSIRTILAFKNLPESVALEALQLGIDVLIRRKFNKAVDKLNNRKRSLDSTDYFNF
ncbi:hypothetical protein IEL51_002380 [Salmonella enterica]|nr:hypothetical protein [Salmonella enterica]